MNDTTAFQSLALAVSVTKLEANIQALLEAGYGLCPAALLLVDDAEVAQRLGFVVAVADARKISRLYQSSDGLGPASERSVNVTQIIQGSGFAVSVAKRAEFFQALLVVGDGLCPAALLR